MFCQIHNNAMCGCKWFSSLNFVLKVCGLYNGKFEHKKLLISESNTGISHALIEYKGNRRGHSKKLFERRSRLDVRKCVFGNRVTDKGIIYHNVV